MKKFWVSLLALMLSMGLVFGVVGCGQQTADKAPESKAPVEDSMPQEPKINEEEVLDQTVVDYYGNLLAHSNKVNYDELKEVLANEAEGMLFIDIRSPEDYVKGHVKGAINVPFKKVGENLELIRANAEGKKYVFVTCYTGQTAGQAVALLNATGIPARSVNAGMGISGYNKGWITEGNDVVTEEFKFEKEAGADLEGEAKVIADGVAAYFASLPEHSNKINYDELKEVLANEAKDMLFIDIRSSEDFVKGHVKGAINVPFKQVGSKLAEIKAHAEGKKHIFVTCYTGQTAGQTVALLNLAGVPARSVNAGMGFGGYNKGWITEGNEVVTD